MTLYTFTPPTRKSRGGNPITGLLHFVQDPVGSTLGFALASRGGKDDSRNVEAEMLPFTVDDEYDTLNFNLPPISDNIRVAAYQRARQATAEKTLPLLQQVYNTGVVVPGLPKAYRAAARDVAKIGEAKLARGPSPAHSPSQPRTDTGQNFMGGFIPPGGMAGFSQMTPASQLSLTRGARGTRRVGKRRKTRTKRAKRAKVRRTKTRRGKKARLVKGSAAAKRYMAKIRRKRK